MHAYGCGQCIPCRINRRRMWTNRIVLESLLKDDNCFVTLTYEEEKIPRLADSSALPTLRAKDFQDWLKRFRERIAPMRVRYFGCGEYGDTSLRPHYHAVVFGWPACRRGRSHFTSEGKCYCGSVTCSLIRETWGQGHVMVGDLTLASAAYVAGYVTKKMTSKDDERLQGREPEFARMSRVPGIGADALWDVADVILRHGLENRGVDVPGQLAFSGKSFPLGRYLHQKLRLYVGKDSSAPLEAIEEAQKEVRAVWESVLADTPHAPGEFKKTLFLNRLLDAGEGRYNRIVSRSRIFKKRGDL